VDSNNPRLEVLESFRAISKVMRRNFLDQKKHEERFGSPPRTQEFMKQQRQQNKITDLMCKM
jgi:hypothetical protein